MDRQGERQAGWKFQALGLPHWPRVHVSSPWQQSCAPWPSVSLYRARTQRLALPQPFDDLGCREQSSVKRAFDLVAPGTCEDSLDAASPAQDGVGAPGVAPQRVCWLLPCNSLPVAQHWCAEDVGELSGHAGACRVPPPPLPPPPLAALPDPARLPVAACGLYYLAELCEEYVITAKRIIGHTIKVRCGHGGCHAVAALLSVALIAQKLLCNCVTNASVVATA